MNTKMYPILFATVVALSSCQKQDGLVSTLDNAETSSQTITYIYHNEETPLEEITEAPEQVMFMESEQLIYVFDTHEEFAEWGQTSPFSDAIIALENKRTLALNYANENGVIEEYNKTGVIRQDFLDYYAGLDNASYSLKSEAVTMLYSGSLTYKNGSYVGTGDAYPILNTIPYPEIGSMNNRASSYTGLYNLYIVFYDGTWFSGSSVVCSGAITAYNMPSSMNNKTSSVIGM